MIRSSFVILSLCSFMIATHAQSTPPNKNPSGQIVAKTFKPFTGKVSANKVRIRVKPDLDSHIIRQISKNDLLLIVGEEGDFYAVEPPKDTKAYVFRSYVLDDFVEANRVNVRLEPHPDAPIIGQLEAGTKVHSTVSPINHKWLEIPMPAGTRFFVSKEFISSAGGPEYLATMEKRKSQVEDLLNSACMLAETESQKPYEEMSIFAASEQLQSILRGYSDFPEAVNKAKETLAHLKDAYLNKKIAFLEAKAELSPVAKEELISKHREETKEFIVDTAEQTHPSIWTKRNHKKELTPENRFWDSLEESLYLSWTAFHSGKKIDDFYSEQKANGVVLTGKIEPYVNPVRDKPGNYIIKGPNGPIAYIYSTHIDLEKYTNQQVSVTASPRPNNHFAFPAYFVLSVQ
jgi:hypothetical protein